VKDRPGLIRHRRPQIRVTECHADHRAQPRRQGEQLSRPTSAGQCGSARFRRSLTQEAVGQQSIDQFGDCRSRELAPLADLSPTRSSRKANGVENPRGGPICGDGHFGHPGTYETFYSRLKRYRNWRFLPRVPHNAGGYLREIGH
jgi:hypothetical protein